MRGTTRAGASCAWPGAGPHRARVTWRGRECGACAEERRLSVEARQERRRAARARAARRRAQATDADVRVLGVSGRDELSDAAGLIVAEGTGDTDAGRLLLDGLLEDRDLRGALLLARWLLSAGGVAVAAEVKVAAEDGRTDTRPALGYLVALSRHAGRTTQEGA